MSFVRDLRTTLLFGFFAVASLGLSASEFAAGEPIEDWLVSLTAGTFLALLVLDGLQRRWRGDERAATADPDARTLAAVTVGLVGVALVGLGSLALGHPLSTWAPLLALGVAGAATSAWRRHRLGE